MAVDPLDPWKTVEDNQRNIYILAGVFSGFIFVLLVLVTVLFCWTLKLSKDLWRRGREGQPSHQKVPSTFPQSVHQYGPAGRGPETAMTGGGWLGSPGNPPQISSVSEDELAMRGFQTYAPRDERFPPKLPPSNFPHGNSPRPNSAGGGGAGGHGGNRPRQLQSPSAIGRGEGQQGDGGQSSYFNQRNLDMAGKVWNEIPAELKDAAKDEAIGQFKSLF